MAGPGVSGFVLESQGVLSSWAMPWTSYRHGRNGLRVVRLIPGDGEHFIGISFRTPARDPRGIPHVLEHGVLNGSTSYPVRDAFNELWRGSLHTHLNAVTMPDRTVYFAGSTSPVDFTNLAGVYLDLVFNPLLDRRRLLLESFHLTPVRRGRRFAGLPGGVVYTEMRGSYSDPEELAFLALQAAILPDTPYRNDPGGNPTGMATLSWEDIKAYHEAFYRPSNCLVMLYSDMEEDILLGLLDRATSGAGSAPAADSAIPLQKRWGRPRKLRMSIPSGLDGDQASLSWLVGETADGRRAAMMQVIEDILLSEAGDLARALLESGLGADLTEGTGLDLDMREMVFTAGLRGCSRTSAGDVGRIVLETLERFARGGPDPAMLEAALNWLFFRYSDRVEDLPLRLFMRSLRSWTYDRPPEVWLDHAATVTRLAGSPGLSRELAESVRTLLLANPHRLELHCVPGRRRSGERVFLLSEGSLPGLHEQARSLEEYSSGRDKPSELSRIPRPGPADLPLEERAPAMRDVDAGGSRVRIVEAAGGNAWVDLAFDADHLSREEDLLLPLAARTVTGTSVGGMDHRALSTAIARCTGGIDCEPLGFDRGPGRGRSVVVLSAGFAPGRTEEALSLVRSILLEGDPRDPARLDEIVGEMAGDASADLLPSADWYAGLAASAAVSGRAARRETWEGMSQVLFLRGLDRRRPPGLPESLVRLRRTIFRRGALSASVCAPASCIDEIVRGIAALAGDLPGDGAPPPPVEPVPAGGTRTLIRMEGAVPSVAVVAPAPLRDHGESAVFTVGTTAVSDGMLYRRLRMAGGAYEVGAWHDSSSGLLQIYSHRDPDPARTLALVRRLPELLPDEGPGEEDVRLAILSAFSAMERPLGPRGWCRTALGRMLTGLFPEDISRERRAIASVTHREIAARYPGLLAESLGAAAEAVAAPTPAVPSRIFGEGAPVRSISAGRLT